MSKDEASIEAEIREKSLTAPRLTPTLIDEQIAQEVYSCAGLIDWDFRTPSNFSSQPALSCLTLCVLVLKNGFTVVGKSACASPENFDYELGRKIAREDARQQIWALEGYHLRKTLSE